MERNCLVMLGCDTDYPFREKVGWARSVRPADTGVRETSSIKLFGARWLDIGTTDVSLPALSQTGSPVVLGWTEEQRWLGRRKRSRNRRLVRCISSPRTQKILPFVNFEKFLGRRRLVRCRSSDKDRLRRVGVGDAQFAAVVVSCSVERGSARESGAPVLPVRIMRDTDGDFKAPTRCSSVCDQMKE